jgi:endoglucanase
MAPGINLGNTLESVDTWDTPPYTDSKETVWGNPPANQAIFTAYAAAGFKSVRIPVSWAQYVDANGNIAPFWLARVRQVVDYARTAGLYVIINIHHDSWVIPDNANKAAADAKMKSYWKQIATYFKDYDNHLLFAGTNEVHMPDVYSAPTAENCAVQSGFNQDFVDAVRATGGNNASRTLIVQLYATNIDWGPDLCNEGTLPADIIANRLMVEMHWYDPFDFTINDKDTTHWQWGVLATDLSAVETWGNEAHTRQEYDKAKAVFVDKGVPVIMGEFGAYPKPSGPGQGVETYTNYWAQYNTYAAVTRGIVPMWWDTGAIIDRNTGAVKDSSLLNALTAGMTTNPEPPASVGNANND